MNPLYDALMTNQPRSMNSLMKMQYMMQAIRNPAAFVRQAFPDILVEIQNNPNQILQYLQQTRHISNQQIQDLINQNSHR